jgi:hypothetical protein
MLTVADISKKMSPFTRTSAHAWAISEALSLEVKLLL